ncbi:MAG: pilus assembly protein PilM [Candidatus Omnitrophota bacterium]|nr:pilus assembly protein PilM [Candidatus Omnitrophota bacterium]
MRFFKIKKKVITILEIGGDWLKVVQAEPLLSKDRKISRVIIKNIASLSDQALIKIITELSKELKINPDILVVSVPYHLVAVRNLELPSTDLTEIKDMVELQIGKQTPFSRDEIVYDYQVLGTNREGYSGVISAIVQREIIERYFRILEGAGFKAEGRKMALSSEGLVDWARFVYKQPEAGKPYVLIDVNHTASDFEVILNDKLIYSRSISLGFLQFEQDFGRWQEKFVEEVKHSIYAYQNEMLDKEISQILISGAEPLVKGLNADILKERLGLGVGVIAPFKSIPLAGGTLTVRDAGTKGVSVSALLGLALAYPRQEINFIPQELRIEKKLKEKGRDLYFLGIYLILILVIVSSIFLGRMHNKERYLSRLKQEVSGTRARVEKLTNMITEVKIIKDRLTTEGILVRFIYEIHKAVSPDVHLASIRFDGKDHLTIRGVSKTMSEIFNFVSALEDSRCFRNVKTKYATKHKVKNKEMANFEIICPLAAGFQQRLTRISRE